ncbi:MAG: arsenate reductase ArsC [Gammaproteobacteria bacterium]|nr:arsenate reductase ArsC [Gammaproteobacteria bacterium]
MNDKPKVAFICVHNSCRSQIAEALGKHYAGDVFESYSAGTEVDLCIDKDAVRLMKEKYDIDMEKTQYPKNVESLPIIDVKISMGCGVSCPHIHAGVSEDWELEDPRGRGDDFLLMVIDRIDMKIRGLVDSLRS